jgi:hypothetical protein
LPLRKASDVHEDHKVLAQEYFDKLIQEWASIAAFVQWRKE